MPKNVGLQTARCYNYYANFNNRYIIHVADVYKLYFINYIDRFKVDYMEMYLKVV